MATECAYRGPGWLHLVIQGVGAVGTVVALVLLYLELTSRIPNDLWRSYILVDSLLCGVFASEFCLMLYMARDRRGYVRHHWPDLLASVPMIHELRAFRGMRVLRLLRAFRAGGLFLRAFRQFEDLFSVPLMRSALVVAAIALLVGAIAIADVERENQNLNSFEKGLWWAAVTMATVGYGDACPTTGLGKCLAVVIMVIGIGLFGVVAGTCASLITRSPQDPLLKDRRIAELEARCTELELRVGSANPPDRNRS